MLAGIIGFVSGMFSSTRAQDSAIDALRKLGNLNEMTLQEKGKWVLEYMAVTTHQSPMRRLIAIVMCGLFALLVVTWLISAAFGYLMVYVPALEFAGAVKMFLMGVVLQPYNLILSFYFLVHIAQKVGK